jgi:hypothetical protein
MSHTVILKNTTASQIIIRDLAGMRIEASSQYEASKNRTLADIQNSEQLKTDISSGDIVVNDGSNDLSVSDALELVTSYDPHFAVQYITFKSATKTWQLSINDEGGVIPTEIV